MNSRSIGGRGRHRTRIALWCASLTALTAVAGVPAALGAASDPAGPPGTNPDNRRFEVVSPQAKGGADVLGDKTKAFAQVSEDGEKVIYSSPVAFAGASSANRPNFYLAERGAAAWLTAPLLPPFDATLAVTGWGLGMTAMLKAVSPDLDRSVVMTNEALAPGSNGRVMSLYLQENPGSGYVNLMPNGPDVVTAFLSPQAVPMFQGASEALDHVVWTSSYPFTPDAADFTTTPEVDYNLYETVDGEIRLVSYLPGEIPLSSPGAVPVVNGNKGRHAHRVSADGSRIFWMNGGVNYVRLNGVETRALPEGKFGAANPAGTKVLMGDTMRMYDVDSQQTQDLIPGDPLLGKPLVASEELDYVYFLSEAELVPGMPPLSDPPPEQWPRHHALYLWHDGEIRHIVNLVVREDDLLPSNEAKLDDISGSVIAARSPDGRKLAFSTASSVDGVYAGGQRQVFVYDERADELTCASCPPGGQATRAAALRETDDGGGFTHYFETLGDFHNVSRDGSRVFFQSASRLVDEDVNGRIDVYVWQDGDVHLVSNGKGEHDARFVAASPSGDDVFFATANRLVGWDADDLVDVYDARVGGGYAEPPPPAPDCAGDGCQGAPSGSPDRRVPASETTRSQRAATVIGSGKRCSTLAAKARKAQRRSLVLGRRASGRNGAQRKRLVRAQRLHAKRAKKLQRQARACLRSAK